MQKISSELSIIFRDFATNLLEIFQSTMNHRVYYNARTEEVTFLDVGKRDVIPGHNHSSDEDEVPLSSDLLPWCNEEEGLLTDEMASFYVDQLHCDCMYCLEHRKCKSKTSLTETISSYHEKYGLHRDSSEVFDIRWNYLY